MSSTPTELTLLVTDRLVGAVAVRGTGASCSRGRPLHARVVVRGGGRVAGRGGGRSAQPGGEHGVDVAVVELVAGRLEDRRDDVDRAQQLGCRRPAPTESTGEGTKANAGRCTASRQRLRELGVRRGFGQQMLTGPEMVSSSASRRPRRASRAARPSGSTGSPSPSRAPSPSLKSGRSCLSGGACRSITGAVRSTHTRAPARSAGAAAACQSRQTPVISESLLGSVASVTSSAPWSP